MKKALLLLSIFIIMALACNLSVPVEPPTSPATLPTNTMIPATVVPTLIPATSTPAALQPTFEGVEVSVDPLNITLPPGLANGVRGSQMPRVERQDHPYWDLTPGHTQLKLEGYLLQGKFHEPQIYVYPAQAYAEMVPGAFESIRRLDNILHDPNASISEEQLPTVPFFNAAQVFASNIQVISFQIRFSLLQCLGNASYHRSCMN